MSDTAFNLGNWLAQRGEVPFGAAALPRGHGWSVAEPVRDRVPIATAVPKKPPASVNMQRFDAIVSYKNFGPVMRFLAEISPDAADVYIETVKRNRTARELNREKRLGMAHPEATLYSTPDRLSWQDFGDTWLERLERSAGHRAGIIDGWLRAFAEGTTAFSATFTLGTAAVAGVGLLRKDVGEQVTEQPALIYTPEDAPQSVTDESFEPQRPTPLASIISDETVAAALRQINSLEHDAATPGRARDGASNNQRYAAVSSIFAGTDILQRAGLLRTNGYLATLDEHALSGEFAGMARLESGLDTTVEAVRASTDDRARGLFQFKPETSMALLGIHGHRLNAVEEDLVTHDVQTAIQRCMRRLGAMPREQLRELGINPTQARIAANYSFDNPGLAARHSNLFHLAYENACSEADKEIIRAAVVDQTPIILAGQAAAPRGGIVSTVLAGLLADELDVPPELAERYGFRVFGYISHQAGERGANRIIAALSARDALDPETDARAWQRADRHLRQTILSSVRPRSNPSVYIAEQHRSVRHYLPEHVMAWDNIVSGINAMYGISDDANLPLAVATLSAAVSSGQVVLAPADNTENAALALAAGNGRATVAVPRGVPRADGRAPS